MAVQQLRSRVTTIIQRQGPAANAVTNHVTRSPVAMREEIYSAEQMKDPQQIAGALQALSQHVRETTQAARSFPMHGGTYWPSVKFPANTALTLAHGCQPGLPVAWETIAPRPTAVNALAVVVAGCIEVSQDVASGRITLASNIACTYDFHFYTRPQGVR